MHELEATVNSELARVQEWLKLNQMTLKIKKKQISLFSNPTKTIKKRFASHMLNGNVLQRVEEIGFLGIVTDKHLTWKNHIDYITKKILRIAGLLCKIRF